MLLRTVELSDQVKQFLLLDLLLLTKMMGIDYLNQNGDKGLLIDVIGVRHNILMGFLLVVGSCRDGPKGKMAISYRFGDEAIELYRPGDPRGTEPVV